MLQAQYPTVLAIDTATEYGSVALVHGGHTRQRMELLGQGHSRVLLPWIQDMLQQANLSVAACDAIAFGAGPGSFTGLRIACGLAQGLAWGCRKPLIAVGNLKAMAWQAAQEAGQGACRVVCAIDARMGEVYWALFDVADDQVDEVVPPSLAGASQWIDEALPYRPALVAGNALTVFDLAWPDASARCLQALRVCAAAVASLAVSDLRMGRTMAPAQASLLYVRNQVALTIEQRAAAKAGEV